MPEGPSIVILRELLAPYVHKTVRKVGGDAPIDIERMRGRRILDIRSWGKHLLIEFSGFSLRVHLLLFGSYSIGRPKPQKPRLSLYFARDELHFYACSVKYVEGDLDAAYDWAADVMSEDWDAAAARRKLRTVPDRYVCDAVLDQSVFSGAGNIIKNEVLYRIRVHPLSRVGALPARKLAALVAETRDYSFEFLERKREGSLSRSWQVHTREHCPNCGGALALRDLGRSRRRSFYCERCQVLYRSDELPLSAPGP
jgi:endonuclease-8